MNRMNKPILFANPVRDLTIARYLAAMEVDYIGIDLDFADIHKTKALILQIKEWISGPKLIGVSAAPPQDVFELYPLDGYFINDALLFPDESVLIQSRHYFLNHPSSNPDYIVIDHVGDRIENRKCILKTDTNEIAESSITISGFMFSPGREDKIGLYDFEKLDEWFELIQAEK